MSARKQITVTRNYQPDPGCMESALALLLKKTVKEGGAPAAPDDTRGDSKHDTRAKSIIPSE